MSLGLGSSLGRLGAWAAGGWIVVESGSSGFGGSCESDWLGGSGSLVGIFFLFDLIQKYFQMELLSFMTHKNLMIPKPLVV